MTSRTGLFPAVTHSKKEERPSCVMLKFNISKPSVKKTKDPVLGSALNADVSRSVSKGPHAACEACSAKKSLPRMQSPTTDAKITFLKRKSEFGFLTAQKPKKFQTLSRSRSTENLAPYVTVPRSILKKDELRAQESQRRVQFTHQATDQASLRAKLNNWLKEKGKTPGSCKNLLTFGAHLSAVKRRSLTDVTSRQDSKENVKPKDSTKYRKNLFGEDKTDLSRENERIIEDTITHNETDTTNNEVCTKENMTEHIKSMLEECLALYHDGCSLEIILAWLAKMETSIPDVVNFAPFYVCKAKVLKDFPQMVLEVYTQAVRNNAQPCNVLADEMKAAITQWLMPCDKSSKLETTDSFVTFRSRANSECPTPFSKNQTPEKSEGSTVKYKITTPANRQTSEAMSVVTPVRRSLRLSSRLPTPNRRSDVVENIEEISPTDRRSMVFKINPLVPRETDTLDKLNLESLPKE
ncbi:cytoskeleton-associated protein 2-like [Biomphalaria glabrata]|uniref:Cytoskeleton-associated protein 2-like n=1 Tax=Biomphalaria glabrata TaxID=6526 RepID=A0A9U8E701_BIOGL|nr:cytoskeleton-associated protein 2-like [Biomphalaria glabrata]XP_055893604.1 cytoskeleton-associated protein 2-like [Biomphalaria glabrata]XP_055893605.1 cytoskeleton-associated protein 2-like [Biomphalaria glabrata]